MSDRKRRQPQPSAAARPDGLLAPFALAATVFVVHARALRAGFLNWDDPATLLLNPHYRGLGWPELRWMFTTRLMGHYMPLTWLTYGLDFDLWGLAPFGYHLTSVLFHCAGAVAFYCVARRLLVLAEPGAARPTAVAALAALLFALHPLRVESVAWVTERRDVVSGFFYLLSLLCYLRAASPQDAPRRTRWLALSAAAFAGSLLSKITGITLPFVLMVLDVYPLRRAWTRRVWAEKLPFFVLTVPAAAWGVLGQTGTGAFVSFADWGVPERVAVALYGAAFYATKTLAPWGLSPLYRLPAHARLLDAPFLLSGLLVAAVTVGAVVLRRSRPALLAVWTVYLVTLLPVSGVLQSGDQLAADRYTYVPCLGFALLAAAALDDAGRRLGSRGWVPAAVVLAALSGLTWRQTGVWRDSEVFWRSVLARDPGSAVAHDDLANALVEEGRLDEAIAEYGLALAAKPDMVSARYNLGNALVKAGRPDEAAAQYASALSVQPDLAQAHTALAELLAGQGKTDAAIREYGLALRTQPDSAAASYDLATLLSHQGRYDEAVSRYEQALRAQPDLAEAQNGLGIVLAKRGDADSAIAHFRAALTIAPDYRAARDNLDLMLGARTIPAPPRKIGTSE